MMNRRLMMMMAGAALVAACAPAPAPVASSETGGDGRLILKSRDAPGLAGKWSGSYVADTGFRGQTTLTLTPASADTVNGVFEYRWSGSNYSRFPKSGTVEGVISSDGTLDFGSWKLTAERSGDTITFRTRQKVGGYPSKLDWSKTTSPLRSEATGD